MTRYLHFTMEDFKEVFGYGPDTAEWDLVAKALAMKAADAANHKIRMLPLKDVLEGLIAVHYDCQQPGEYEADRSKT